MSTNTTVYPFGTEGRLPANVGIINDCETGGADKALAAQQGVVIKNNMKWRREIVLSHYRPRSGALLYEGTWGTSNKNKYIQVPVTAGDVFRITPNSSYSAEYAFMTEEAGWSSGGDAPIVADTHRYDISPGQTVEDTVPATCTFLLINILMNAGAEDHTPAAVELIFSEHNEAFERQDASDMRLNDAELSIRELRGTPELFDYDTVEVSTSNSARITIQKDGNGGILIKNVDGGSAGRALIAYPSSMEVGKEYEISFRYFSQHDKTAWALNSVGSSGETITNYIFDLLPNVDGRAVKRIVFGEDDTYMRLLASSTAAGSRAYIYDISICEVVKSNAELSELVSDNSDIEVALDQARFVAESPTTPPLTLLHFSDIHNDTLAGRQIKKFFEKYSTKIDDMVQTGDVVQLYLASNATGFPWFDEHGIPEALFVLGNHDGSCNSTAHGWKEGNADWDYFGREWDFDTYFADYITTRGITPPEGYDDPESPYYKACYFHKDYATAKVRVIGIDGMHFNDGVRNTSNDQETWLAAKLAETLDSNNAAYGFSVIFLCHFPLDDYSGNNETWDDSSHKFVYNQNQGGGHIMDSKTGYQVPFHYGSSYTAEKKYSLRKRIGTAGSTSYTKGEDNPIGDVIQTWVNNGGKFVVWLSGHTHTEYMYYPAKYPNLLVMGLPQAGNTRGTPFGNRSDASPMHPAANILVVDTQNKLLKVIRFGNVLDKNLISREYLCYDYQNKAVLGSR